MNAIVAQFRSRFAAASDTPEPAPINRGTPNPPLSTHPVPATDAAFHALEGFAGYWHGRAIGRLQATEAMDLSRDALADHQAVAEFEARASRCARESV